MKKSSFLRHSLVVACMALVVPALSAQTSIQLFGPVNVRASVDGTTYDAPNTFNSNTLNLTCPGSPTGVLSSANGGNLLVDNNIQVSTSSPSMTGPTNVCTGGTADGSNADCFTTTYQSAASAGQLTGQDPDSFAASTGVTLANGGVPPIDIHNSLASGSNQITISEVDGGGELASSSLYLTTNCTQGGVTGGGSITGNPISSNPTPQQLTQNFTFNTGSGLQVQFVYDLSTAESSTTDTLAIQNGTIPGVEDAAVDPSTFQSVYGVDTPFSTSNCLIHTGEVLANGQPACKLFTLECAVGTDPAESGANCPISSAPNELFQDIFDGPSFSLQDISTPNGPTFHEGIGFLMASEPWKGGPCAFDPASGLGNLPCPQNLLANFSGPGIYTSSSYTSHPNSTFIPVYGVPEPLTTVTVANQQAGGWVNTQTPNVTFSSQPPILSGLMEAQLPGVSKFAAAPIQSITYGTASVGSVPTPGVPGSAGTAITNPVSCPTTIPPPPAPSQPAFTPPAQPVALNADGNYLLYYFAQDCAGTQELDFVKDGTTGSWSTSYYTVPINVDTVAPTVSSGPTLSPSSGSYTVGQPVTATYSCTDDRSGIVTCGASTFTSDSAPLSTGPLTSPVDTSTPGNKTFTVMAVDAAGNKSSQMVSYVVTAYDSSIHVTLSQYTVTYPGGTNVVIQVSPTGGHTATGTVKLYDGTTLLQSSALQGNGAAYLYIQRLNVGSHSLTASYSGDSNNAAGVSGPVIFTVKPVPVQLSTSCWNANFPYGADYHCGIYTSSAAGAPQGVVTYQYDGGATVTLPLSNGVANFVIPMPPVGNHTVMMGYAAQTNYAAANSSTVHFTVTKAPVILQLTPSTWYATGGNVTLSVAIQSWSAGPPNALGTVSFYSGKNLLATAPVTAAGTAATTVTAASLGNGSRTLTASYSGSANYASGTASLTITVAVK